MDEQTATQLKKRLLEEKALIEARLGEIAKRNPAIKGDWTSVPPDIADPADSMDEKAQSVTTLQERRALEQNFELRLKEIEQTLQKIDQGTYGTCNSCQSPIEQKRLQALPAVSTCFDCASNPSFS